jgi:hypothetical protein
MKTAALPPNTEAEVWLRILHPDEELSPRAARNPRRHTWSRHFRWTGPILVGRTSVGRATIAVLGINSPHRVRHRAELIAEGVFPYE